MASSIITSAIYLVARVEPAAPFDPSNAHPRKSIGLGVALLVAAGATVGFIWRERSSSLHRQQAAAAAALRELATQRDASHRAERELAVRARVADILLSIPDGEMYTAVLQLILSETASSRGAFAYVDRHGALVTASVVAPSAATGSQAVRTAAARGAHDRDCWCKALREKQSNVTPAPAGWSASHAAEERQVTVPLLSRDAVVGLLQVAGREEDYSGTDLHLLEIVAGHVAPVLEARLQRQLHESDLRQRDDEVLRFSYAVSHDLKSPLVTVMTFLGFLEADMRLANSEAIAKDLEFIRGATAKMSHMLDELLGVSGIGRKTSPCVETCLQTIVAEALALTADRLAARGIQLEVTDAPFTLFGDHRRLVELFENLLDNAAKFMGDRAEPRIVVGVESTLDGPVVFLRDNGIGIDPRYQHRLFGLFEKLDPQVEGSGVGLALVRRIVEIHGGRIWVESAGVGLGSTFKFTLAGTRPATPGEIPQEKEVSA